MIELLKNLLRSPVKPNYQIISQEIEFDEVETVFQIYLTNNTTLEFKRKGVIDDRMACYSLVTGEKLTYDEIYKHKKTKNTAIINDYTPIYRYFSFEPPSFKSNIFYYEDTTGSFYKINKGHIIKTVTNHVKTGKKIKTSYTKLERLK